jgi:hypothetical protein
MRFVAGIKAAISGPSYLDQLPTTALGLAHLCSFGSLPLERC